MPSHVPYLQPVNPSRTINNNIIDIQGSTFFLPSYTNRYFFMVLCEKKNYMGFFIFSVLYT